MSWAPSTPNRTLSEAARGREARPGVGSRLKDVGWQGAGQVIQGLGTRMRVSVVTQVMQTGEERWGVLVPGAEAWGPGPP